MTLRAGPRPAWMDPRKHSCVPGRRAWDVHRPRLQAQSSPRWPGTSPAGGSGTTAAVTHLSSRHARFESYKQSLRFANTFCFGKTAAARLSSWVGVGDAGWVQLGDESGRSSTEHQHSPAQRRALLPPPATRSPAPVFTGKPKPRGGMFRAECLPRTLTGPRQSPACKCCGDPGSRR